MLSFNKCEKFSSIISFLLCRPPFKFQKFTISKSLVIRTVLYPSRKSVFIRAGQTSPYSHVNDKAPYTHSSRLFAGD